MITIVVPFIDSWDITSRCIEVLARNTTKPTELLLIDNGSDKQYAAKCKDLLVGSQLNL